ncbi:phage major capsid protein [Streptomyces sp. NPDC001507]|uniref:phage major capsid protein n=1 Tax=Streptomyces sp. NPDC001507 TaxID=3364579 RepID=UPI0036C9ED31
MSRLDLIDDLRIKRDEAKRSMDFILDRVKRGNRAFSDSERQVFDKRTAEVEAFNQRIEELEEAQRMDDSAAETARRFAPGAAARNNSGVSMPTASARITSEPAVYRRDSKDTSWFLDAYAVSKSGDSAARERLQRNARQVTDQRKQEGRALSTTNGAGGEMVPPLWMESEWIRLARSKRVTADLVVNEPLPAGTDSLNIPKVATGTATGLQGTQNTAVTQVDMTTTAITANVLTLAGSQVISLQLAEQSPLNVDTVILGDLAADLATKVNAQVISGSGTGGNATGILTLAGTGQVSWTGTDGATFQAAVLKAIGQVFASTFEAPDSLVLAPRRAVWLMAQKDSTGRPLLVPADNGPTNSMGVLAPLLATEGPIGRFCGLNVYIDGGIPLTLGGSSNEDRAIVMRSSEIRLWESQPKFEVFPQTYAANLSLLARAYEYMAFTAARYPGGVSVLSGSGFTSTNTL